MEHNEPNYFAVIPTRILFHDGLIPSAILLYGAIASLTQEKGYCWAKDSYFANKFNVSKTTVQNWLKSLEEFEFIRREVVYKEGSKEILHRYIRILEKPTQENLRTPTQENLRDNNKSFNNINNNNKGEEKPIPYQIILDYLNTKANKKFKGTDSHKTKIRARWNEGYNLEDFKTVIDNKVLDADNPNSLFDKKYLQPSTLFGNKFDEYLNSSPSNYKKTGQTQSADELFGGIELTD